MSKTTVLKMKQQNIFQSYFVVAVNAYITESGPKQPGNFSKVAAIIKRVSLTCDSTFGYLVTTAPIIYRCSPPEISENCGCRLNPLCVLECAHVTVCPAVVFYVCMP